MKDGTQSPESFMEKRGWVQTWTDRERKKDSLSLDEGTCMSRGLGVNMTVAWRERDQPVRNMRYKW